ncbi:voltage-dependent calcium channel unc-36 [Plakobranchus ocellatus]|uniref:Voltage-dependent calcium channel unc-36 n=1 Tax=Plakobranchus ocellatus TaxID=259542 RepID=A0AAV4CKX4_9GAST|nr:voltage-dependent calcium channel unc-36 [Plakobranchus ocellatus]
MSSTKQKPVCTSSKPDCRLRSSYICGKQKTFMPGKRLPKQVKTSHSVLALAFDFKREMPCPNKPTNDIYYQRQLSLQSFSVHVLASDWLLPC